MIAFLEVALRLQNAQILPLDSWKTIRAPGSPGAATRAVPLIRLKIFIISVANI